MQCVLISVHAGRKVGGIGGDKLRIDPAQRLAQRLQKVRELDGGRIGRAAQMRGQFGELARARIGRFQTVAQVVFPLGRAVRDAARSTSGSPAHGLRCLLSAPDCRERHLLPGRFQCGNLVGQRRARQRGLGGFSQQQGDPDVDQQRHQQAQPERQMAEKDSGSQGRNGDETGG